MPPREALNRDGMNYGDSEEPPRLSVLVRSMLRFDWETSRRLECMFSFPTESRLLELRAALQNIGAPATSHHFGMIAPRSPGRRRAVREASRWVAKGILTGVPIGAWRASHSRGRCRGGGGAGGRRKPPPESRP